MFLVCLATFCSLSILWDIILPNYLSFGILFIKIIILGVRALSLSQNTPQDGIFLLSQVKPDILIGKGNHVILRTHARKGVRMFSECESCFFAPRPF